MRGSILNDKTGLKNLPRDVVSLIIKDLSLTDVSNLYKAGDDAKIFVKKILQNECFMRYKVKRENLDKYNNLLKLCSQFVYLKWQPNGIFYHSQTRKGKHVEIWLNKSFFEEYHCFRLFYTSAIQIENLTNNEICEISVNDPNRIISKTKNFGWDCLSIEKISSNIKEKLLIPDEGLINLEFDNATMSFIFDLLEDRNVLFSVNNNNLTITSRKSISRDLFQNTPNFEITLKIDKVHFLHYYFHNIIFSLSDNFLLLRSIEKDYEFKIFFTRSV